MKLADAPHYWPLAGGVYRVAPGLRRFGADLGGAPADAHVFQLDNQFARYRAAKLAARRRHLGKYLRFADFDPLTAKAVTAFILDRLTLEHPQFFLRQQRGQRTRLRCRLTRQTLTFDPNLRLIDVHGPASNPPFQHAVDALASQVQEDLAILRFTHNRHWLCALHLCYPNGWSARDKIGQTFAQMHQPVAHMEMMIEQEPQLVDVMEHATAGIVRFAWGLSLDDALDHHPSNRPRVVTFDPRHPRGWLRVERQTLWGRPEAGMAIFTIRTYLHDLRDIARDSAKRNDLASAVAGMSDKSRKYKQLDTWADALIEWLRSC